MNIAEVIWEKGNSEDSEGRLYRLRLLHALPNGCGYSGSLPLLQ